MIWYDKDVLQNIGGGSFDIGLDPISVYKPSGGQRGVSDIYSAARRLENGTEVRQFMEMTGCEEVQGACRLLTAGIMIVLHMIIRLDRWPDCYGLSHNCK